MYFRLGMLIRLGINGDFSLFACFFSIFIYLLYYYVLYGMSAVNGTDHSQCIFSTRYKCQSSVAYYLYR